MDILRNVESHVVKSCVMVLRKPNHIFLKRLIPFLSSVSSVITRKVPRVFLTRLVDAQEKVKDGKVRRYLGTQGLDKAFKKSGNYFMYIMITIMMKFSIHFWYISSLQIFLLW